MSGRGLDECFEVDRFGNPSLLEQFGSLLEVLDGSLCFPNAFIRSISENSLNSSFTPFNYCDDVEDYNINIFNRWDAEIFSSSSINPSWDDLSKGSPVPSEVHLYFVSYIVEVHEFSHKGNVTPIR